MDTHTAVNSKPASVARVHREICDRQRCDHLDKINYLDPYSACPNGHFGPYLNAEDSSKQRIGLGDIVEKLGKPIARALKLPCLDKAGNLRPESGCAKRRDALNRLTSGKQP